MNERYVAPVRLLKQSLLRRTCATHLGTYTSGPRRVYHACLDQLRWNTLYRVAKAQQMMVASADPKDGSRSRRAAYNVLLRLKKNQTRLEQAPAKLRERLLDGHGIPSDLIDTLLHHGDLDAFVASFQTTIENKTSSKNKDALVPMTERQVRDLYGEDADAVMQTKIDQGLTEKDRNRPGSILYIMFEKRRWPMLARRVLRLHPDVILVRHVCVDWQCL